MKMKELKETKGMDCCMLNYGIVMGCDVCGGE
jgi:hypothetical protein